MSESDDKKIQLSLPYEWAIQKTLGPTLDEIGIDLVELYSHTKVGVAKIALAAKNKIKKDEQGNEKANLRVTRDVFWNGGFTEDDICAEYFGGVLAGSRSTDGKDDTGIFYLDLMKSMSSSQLKLHFMIYSCLNKILAADSGYASLNMALAADVSDKPLYISTLELLKRGVRPEIDLVALNEKNLIQNFAYNQAMHPDKHHITQVEPTTLGIQLFAVAANELINFREFNKRVFNNFSFSEELPIASFAPSQLFISPEDDSITA